MRYTSDDLLATTAITLGVGQMIVNLKHVYDTDDVRSYNLQSVYIGITASSLWLLYQYRHGANYTVVYTSFGLAAQLYLLQRISAKGKEAVKDEIHSIM
jgi:uncharacterized protein with PQ loop repeat